MEKIHVVYKIEDKDGNYYIGKHSTFNLDDGYIGSGTWSKLIFDENIEVSKTYLGFYDTPEEAYEAEYDILGESWKNDSKCKNIIQGGKISAFEDFTYSKFCLIKWGVEHHMKSEEFKSTFNFPFKSDIVQQKVHETIISRYGARGAAADGIKEKMEKTNLEKYGETHTLNIADVKNAREIAIMEKYGVDNPWKNREMYEQTLLEKHGWKNPMDCAEIRLKHKNTMMTKDWTERNKKSKLTCLEKYGTEDLLNTPEIRNKHKRSCPYECKNNHKFYAGNFSIHMKKIHNWSKEEIQRYKNEN